MHKYAEIKCHAPEEQWLKKEIKVNENIFETNGNKNTTYQNLSDTVLQREVILTPTLRKKIRPQLNNLTFHLKELEKEGKTDP